VLVGFRERASHLIAQLARCEVLAAPIGELITPLASLIGELSIRDQLPQIEVAVAMRPRPWCCGCWPRHPKRISPAVRVRSAARSALFLQTGGIDTVRPLSEPSAPLSYSLPEAGIELEFTPTDFIQVNAQANRALSPPPETCWN